MHKVRAVVAVCVAVWLCARCGVQACCVVSDSDVERQARTRGVLRRVHDGEHAAMRAYFPEGGLFSLSFTGFALAAQAVTSGDDEDRARARREIPWLLSQTDAEANEDPFASWGNDPWRGVIFEGHRNLLRAAYAVVGGDDERILAEFHRVSERLARAFLAAPSGNLESFPRQVWPVDNVVALESLRLHDVLFHTDYREAIVRWSEHERRLVDPTGLPVSEIDVDGARVRDGPRGCALSWTQAFLPALDAELAASLWRTDKDTWSVDVVGMRGLREWPPGERGRMDADSGPVVADIGAAASAFGVAAASVNGDADMRARMLLPLDTLTFPAANWRGEVELFGGQLLLADVLALWASTWTRLDAPMPAPSSSPPLLGLTLCLALILAPPLTISVSAARAVRRVRVHRAG
jgi:hypothetical protein